MEAWDKIADQNAQRQWVDVNERLPEHGQYVLIKTNITNCTGHGGRLLQYHVATFYRGRPQSEVQRTRLREWADEDGNNLRPYRWGGEGPMDFFGQVVTHWMPISALEVPHD
jgi:hypothetical protein